jgi:hypothetical protein
MSHNKERINKQIGKLKLTKPVAPVAVALPVAAGSPARVSLVYTVSHIEASPYYGKTFYASLGTLPVIQRFRKHFAEDIIAAVEVGHNVEIKFKS